jgi:hypothetical protein
MWVPDLRRKDHPNLWHFIQENIENQHTFFEACKSCKPWTISFQQTLEHIATLNTFEALCSLSNLKQLQPVVTSWFGLVGVESSLYGLHQVFAGIPTHPLIITNPNHLGWSEHMSYSVIQLYLTIATQIAILVGKMIISNDTSWNGMPYGYPWIMLGTPSVPFGALGSSHIRSTKQLPVCWALCRIRQEPKIEVLYSIGQ